MHRESVLLGADGREEGQKKKGDEEGCKKNKKTRCCL